MDYRKTMGETYSIQLQLISKSLQTWFKKAYQRVNIFRYNKPNANTENKVATKAFNIFNSVNAGWVVYTRLKDKQSLLKLGHYDHF